MTSTRTRRVVVAVTGLVVGIVCSSSRADAQGPGKPGQQGSAPVHVVNGEDSAVPVRVVTVPTSGPVAGTERTLSFAAGFSPTDDEQTVDAPSCPGGTEFLVSALGASRSTATLGGDITKWEVRVRLEQRYAVGPGVPADLVVVGAGRAHDSQALPTGQATRVAGKITVGFGVEGNAKSGFFIAHVTGSCGVPSVIVNSAVGPGQLEPGSPYPLGWDIKTNLVK